MADNQYPQPIKVGETANPGYYYNPPTSRESQPFTEAQPGSSQPIDSSNLQTYNTNQSTMGNYNTGQALNISNTQPYMVNQPNYSYSGYQNPTASGANQTFGNQEQQQYMIQPFMSPFPFEQQKAENQALISGYEQALRGQETLPAMQSRLEGQFFIPEMREAFQSGREALSDVMAGLRAMPETIAGTTRDSMVTEAQRRNLISAKSQPLREVATQLGENVTRIGAMLTDAEKNMSTRMQMEVAQQKKELQPWEWRYSMNNIMQAREMTGWTTTYQNELNRLLSNQRAGIELSEAEKNRAHQLSMLEREYDLQLRNLEKQYDFGMEFWD